jgi:hypothetical protein
MRQAALRRGKYSKVVVEEEEEEEYSDEDFVGVELV